MGRECLVVGKEWTLDRGPKRNKSEPDFKVRIAQRNKAKLKKQVRQV